MAKEPCAVCGEETAIGSVFYSDRFLVDGDSDPATHMCSLCLAKLRAVHGERLTSEEVRDVVRNGSMAAISWSNR